jgi:hypothetical protein
MQRRAGVTLVEVLVAIFVMGIGLIALLTLFPIGMLRMARAIHDERSGQSAQTASANAVIHSLGADADVVTVPGDPFNAGALNPDVFANPMPRDPTTGAAVLWNADPFSASYPIFVDPIGYYNVAGVSQHWVGGFTPTVNGLPRTATSHQGGLRRRPAEFVRRTAATAAQRNLNIFQAFTLWDDMVFEYDTAAGWPGGPKVVGAAALRDPRFSWGYTMQRPMTSDKSVVEVSVVVFDTRSLSISGAGSLSEQVYPNTTFFDPVKNTISIDFSGPGVVPPPIRPGNWIMDVTPYNPTGTTGSAHAFWYRVVAVQELPGKIARFEVQQPIRGRFQGPSNALGFQGTCVILEGVAEVFDKGPMRLP